MSGFDPTKKKKKTKQPAVAEPIALIEEKQLIVDAQTEQEYVALLDKVYVQIDAAVGSLRLQTGKRAVVAHPSRRETALINAIDICAALARPQEHFLAYLAAELRTQWRRNADGAIIFAGRFQAAQLDRIQQSYIYEYIACAQCKSVDTAFVDGSNTRIVCAHCHAERNVAAKK